MNLKYLIKSFVVYFLIGLFSCTTNNEIEDNTARENIPPTDDYQVIDKGFFKEYYGGTTKLKIEGAYDEDKQRHGIWTFYTIEGKKQSITEYKHGKKHGYAIVYHPNGALYYRGQWHEDKQVGVWDYYDPSTGKKVETKNYD